MNADPINISKRHRSYKRATNDWEAGIEKTQHEAVSVLQKAGLQNPQRVVRLIRDTIEYLELDLRELTVLTEAASGPYVVTPVIAALAGANRVVAMTRNSRYATMAEVTCQTSALELLCGIEGRVDLIDADNLPPAVLAKADIVTNLGFVRPLNRAKLQAMRRGAVIPLMCEAWEIRPSDVDVAACQEHGIVVAGTNEDFPGVDVFHYSGWLASSLLLGAGIEMHKSRIIVAGSDKFASVIHKHLVNIGVDAVLMKTLRADAIVGVDAILVADYTRDEEIIGAGGDIVSADLARLAPGITVVQFAGRVDLDGLRALGVNVYPGEKLPSHRMVRTLAEIGPRPVIELHAAGLKVGQMLARPGQAPNVKYAALVQSIF